MSVELKLTGDRALARAMRRLESNAPRDVLEPALLSSAERIKARVVQNLSGSVVRVRSGELLQAFSQVKPRSYGKSETKVRVGIPPPTRRALGIAADDKSYYPYAIEFGHSRVPARSFLRSATDASARDEFVRIGNDIGTWATRQWRRAR